MNRIYCAVGKLFDLTQKIEINLGVLCENSEIIKEFARHKKMTLQDYNQVKEDAAYIKEKMTTMTFGALVAVLNESQSLNRDDINELRFLLEKRNYFAHEYFKYTNFDGAPEAFIVEEFNAIKEMIARLNKFYSRINLIIKGQNERLDYLRKANNL